MPNIAPVTLTDGTTPVVLNPVSSSRDAALLRKRSTLVPGANTDLAFTSRDQANGAHRSTAKLTYPIVREVGGINEVVENIIIDINVRVPLTATDAEVTYVRKLCEDLFTDGVFIAINDNREGFW